MIENSMARSRLEGITDAARALADPHQTPSPGRVLSGEHQLQSPASVLERAVDGRPALHPIDEVPPLGPVGVEELAAAQHERQDAGQRAQRLAQGARAAPETAWRRRRGDELEPVEPVQREKQSAGLTHDLDLVLRGAAVSEASERKDTILKPRCDRSPRIVSMVGVRRGKDFADVTTEQETPEVEMMDGQLVQDPAAKSPVPSPLRKARLLPEPAAPCGPHEFGGPDESVGDGLAGRAHVTMKA